MRPSVGPLPPPRLVRLCGADPVTVAGRYALTADGFESMFGTNHLGPFLFTNLIRPRLLASASPRVVNVSSAGHGISSVRFDGPGFSGGEKFDKWKDYGQSKTANMLFAVGISQRWRIDAFSLHPGGERACPVAPFLTLTPRPIFSDHDKPLKSFEPSRASRDRFSESGRHRVERQVYVEIGRGGGVDDRRRCFRSLHLM